MRPLTAVAPIAIAVVAASCTLVNDFDGLRNGGGGGAGAAGAGGAGAGGADPCAGGLVREVCGSGRKCTLAVPGQGVPGGVQCGPSGSTPAWSVCDSDADCADGAWCDAYSLVCKPWCVDAAECPTDASCVSAKRADNTPVPGLTICTAHCQPDNPGERCGPGVNCAIENLQTPEGDCRKAGTEGELCSCNSDGDCIPGLRCADDGLCREWCAGPGSCDGGAPCSSPLTTYDGATFGECLPAAQQCIR